MQNPAAIQVLERVLQDEAENPMVRHEAGEALGAIGNESSLPLLEKYSESECAVVRETCQIAAERIRRSKEEAILPGKIYDSVDPTPAGNVALSPLELGEILMNSSLPLYDRYKAMFALRDKGGEESVLQLVRGLFDQNSALFRHEVAYVLGQMQHPASVPGLIKCLEVENEVDMVRHECAEALGSIASDEVLPILQKFKNDKQTVVKESCLVALDIFEYENSNQLHYATMN